MHGGLATPPLLFGKGLAELNETSWQTSLPLFSLTRKYDMIVIDTAELSVMVINRVKRGGQVFCMQHFVLSEPLK